MSQLTLESPAGSASIVQHEHCPRCKSAVEHHNVRTVESPHRCDGASRLIVLYCPRCDCGFGLRQKMSPLGWLMVGPAGILRAGPTIRKLRKKHREFSGE